MKNELCRHGDRDLTEQALAMRKRLKTLEDRRRRRQES